MNAFTIYLLTLLDSISGVAAILLGLCIVMIVICSIAWYEDQDYVRDEEKRIKIHCKWKKRLRALIITICIALMVLAFVPSTNSAVLMYVVPKVTKNKEFTKIPPLIIKYIESQLKSKND